MKARLAKICPLLSFALLLALGSCAQKKSLSEQSAAQIPEITNVAPEFLPLGNSEKKLLANGNKIIFAVKKFATENGHFPKTLDDLVPKYLQEIPKTDWKRRYLLSFKVEDAVFSYSRDDTHFFISVRYDFFDEWYYNSKTKLWQWANH